MLTVYEDLEFRCDYEGCTAMVVCAHPYDAHLAFGWRIVNRLHLCYQHSHPRAAKTAHERMKALRGEDYFKRKNKDETEE